VNHQICTSQNHQKYMRNSGLHMILQSELEQHKERMLGWDTLSLGQIFINHANILFMFFHK